MNKIGVSTLLFKLELMIFLSIFLNSCGLNRNNEKFPEELSENAVSQSTCMPSYGYLEMGSIQPIYNEECPSCLYEITVSNDAEIVSNPTPSSALIRAGVESFKVNFKIVYDGGETNTITRDISVESNDAIAKLNDITYDESITVLEGFNYDSVGYVVANSLSDQRVYKYYPKTDKWQALVIQEGVFSNNISRPCMINTDAYYFDDQNDLYSFSFTEKKIIKKTTLPVNNPKIYYSYNGKYFCGLKDSIFEYDPISNNWSKAYDIISDYNGSNYIYHSNNKAFLIVAGSLPYVLNYETNTLTKISGINIEFDFTKSVIFNINSNLHIITGDKQYILNTADNQVQTYTPNINTCNTTLNSFEPILSNYSFFTSNNKGIAINSSGNVFHFNPK